MEVQKGDKNLEAFSFEDEIEDLKASTIVI